MYLVVVSESSLKTSIQTLTFLGMIEKENEKVGKVTDMGIFATRFPLSVKGSATLWKWIDADYPIFPGIVITCLIDCFDNQSYFFYPYDKQPATTQAAANEQYFKKHFAKQWGHTEATELPKRGLSDIESCYRLCGII